MGKGLGCFLLAAGLMAGKASAVEFFVPIPYLGGSFVFGTEFVRQDLNKDKVDFTFVADGQSGLGQPSKTYFVLPGPSTSTTHPLLTDNRGRDYHRPPDRSDPKWFLSGSGLVIMEGEPGLLGVESAVLIGSDPTSGWELPMLTADDAFKAGGTAYVLNLMKQGAVNSQLSIYNLDRGAALCTTTLSSPKGRVLDVRTNIAVPALGDVRLADILGKVAAASVAGMSVAVSCDHPFYALGSNPAPSLADIRVLYPSSEPPTTGVRENFVSKQNFRVTRLDSVRTFELPLQVNKRYRSITIDFDATTFEPINGAYYRGLVGMWRPQPGQRFGKTLYFGVNERYNRSKLLIDLGTPYIEVLTKKDNAGLLNKHTYHFHIEVNADQELFRQVVTNPGGGVVADIRSGLFNSDLMNQNGNTVIVGFGLPGIGDGAYSPPYFWSFNNITINGYR